MKSLDELKALRDKLKSTVDIRMNNENKMKIVVSMGTCGIAAGARKISAAFTDGIAEKKLPNVTIGLSGCIGLCQYEPVVVITQPGKDKVTYVNMTPERVAEVVSSHVANGNVVGEFTLKG